MKASPWQSVKTLAALVVLLTARVSIADPIKDALDAAKANYTKGQEAAETGLTAAFDSQVKILSQGGDLDAVEALIAQRKTFVTTKTLPSASSMRAAVAIYKDAIASNELKLKAAYETAIADYTKAQDFDDATLMKRLMGERFSAPQVSTQSATNPSTPTTIPGDPTLDALQAAKRDFVATVKQAHAELLAVIEKRANDAADKGDLDGFKRYNAIGSVVLTEILVPGDFKDTVVQGANAKFVRTAETAYSKLRVAYQTAISDYTKARKIEQADAIRTEMGDGGWFENYTGSPAATDLLKSVDLQKNTIRRGWRMNGGTLEPTTWDDDHGPWLEIPVSAMGNYELRVVFTLTRNIDALYVHVPIGKTSAFMGFSTSEQSFNDIVGRGNITSNKHLQLDKPIDVVFRVSLTAPNSVSISVAIDGEQAIAWQGTVDQVKRPTAVWITRVESNFGIGTKSGTIQKMELKKSF